MSAMHARAARYLRATGLDPAHLRDALRRGSSLAPAVWARRHRELTALLWAHVLALLILGALLGHLDALAIAYLAAMSILASLADRARLGRGARAACASLGLVVASAAVVHLAHGYIEAHVHFFVVVVLIALYQEWRPFALAVAFVALHHGVLGTLAPTDVYNHPDAWAHPWKWAAIHAGLVVGVGVASLLNARLRDADATALAASEARLAEAQRVAGLGSWEFVYATRALTYSDEAYRIAGHAPQAFAPTPEHLLAAAHPDDRARVGRFVAGPWAGGEPGEFDYRIVRPDGAIRILHQRAALRRDAAGRPATLVGTVLDVTEQRTLEARLAHQATHDSLTGLPNRALLLDRLDRALAAARADGPGSAVLYLDLDHFKDVNDSRGHDAGDRLLVAVAARLRGALGARDTLARLGGDEFAILLAGVTEAGTAARVAARVLAALAAPLQLDGEAHTTDGSIGIVLATATYERPEDVLRDADVALYRAKDAGRGGYALFDPAMQAALLDRLALERDLALAAERGELRVCYQPKVDLATGRTTFIEALVRWQHPTRGLVPPGEFIALAEESGLIVPVGRWVLAEACRQVVAWDMAHPTSAVPALAVNLSPRQFRDPGLVDDVAAILATTGLPAARLVLEVTESAAMERIDETLATLRALKALRVGLALDDFGTGHSALAYLRQLPLDTLKIDRSFFADNPANRAIVGAVTALAHGLGLEVTAEGLETAAQVAWAREAGCDRGQGFYFARPLPADQVATLWTGGLTCALPQGERAVSQEGFSTVEVLRA